MFWLLSWEFDVPSDEGYTSEEETPDNFALDFWINFPIWTSERPRELPCFPCKLPFLELFLYPERKILVHMNTGSFVSLG